MRRHSADTVTAALRDLDPAPSTELTQAELDRADAAFARIVATPCDEPVPEVQGRPHRSRRRLLVAAGLAGVVGVATPVLLFGGGGAYGSWTPTPVPLTDVDAARAATTCRATLDVPDRGERVAVAERRGGWTYVLLAGPRTEAMCLMPNDFVGQDPNDRRGFFGNYNADRADPPTLDPDRIDENISMEGSTDEGWFDEGWFLWVEGYVGSDVTGVTVHTSSGLDIEASVSGNRFAAWWPSRKQSSDNPASETWSYTVHLADGSTRRAR
jgi:hypothetical protein